MKYPLIREKQTDLFRFAFLFVSPCVVYTELMETLCGVMEVVHQTMERKHMECAYGN